MTMVSRYLTTQKRKKKKKKEAKPRAPVRLPTSDERRTVGEDGGGDENEDGGQRE